MSPQTPATLQALSQALIEGRVTAEDLCRAALARIEEGSGLGTFLHVCRNLALEQAEAVDRKLAAGEHPGPLAGIPIAIKDNIITSGIPTTAGSLILEGFVPTYDATVIQKLKAAGAVIVGKTNLDEFAMGSTCGYSAYHGCANPWSLDFSPGGSSGGSAAALAAGMVPLALGSDTGGSVRLPASLCGVVGLKPTYGRVSRYGLIAFASSLDQIGPMARTVDDAAALLQVIQGEDPRDSTSQGPPSQAQPGRRARKVGLLPGVRLDRLDPEVREALEHGISLLKELGCEFVELEGPGLEVAIQTYYLIACAEASTNLARYDGLRFGTAPPRPDMPMEQWYPQVRTRLLGPEVRRRLILGTIALRQGYSDGLYLKARDLRAGMGQEFREAFSRCDVILGPVSRTPGIRHDPDEDPVETYSNDLFTIPANLAGLPAISIPCRVGKASGLPIGIQLMANRWDDDLLLELGREFEAARGPFPTPRRVEPEPSGARNG